MSNRTKLIDLFKSNGLLFPETEKEVEAFETFYNVDNEKPADWEAPEAILKRGIQKLKRLNVNDEQFLDEEINELKMVARKGGDLPQHVIDRMKEKHKKND